MLQLTGTLFHTANNGLLLIHNEQEQPIVKGTRIVFESVVYVVSGIIPPCKPDARWTLQLRALSKDDRLFDANLCKCFSPPKGTPFVKGEAYEWTWCIDGMVALHDSGLRWSSDEIGFYLHFQPLD